MDLDVGENRDYFLSIAHWCRYEFRRAREHSVPSFYLRNNRFLCREANVTFVAKMRPGIIIVLLSFAVTLTQVIAAPRAQEPAFELPVQLVGFPVIIAAVRITNFVKKLAYSLNPQTYMSRTKRSHELMPDEEILNASEVEKKLVQEMGNNVCILERVCSSYAQKSKQRRNRTIELDWTNLLSGYKSSPDPMKENYLLSVFLGDIVGSPQLCRQLAKRGRACEDNVAVD